MTFYYEVYHYLNPNKKVLLAFRKEPSKMRVKDQACKEGFFSWKYYTELRVKKANQLIPLELFHEVE